MAWREIMHIDITILLEHNAFTCYFNIVNNILLVFCTIHATIHFSQKRQTFAPNDSSDFHTYRRLNSSPNTLSMIFLILFAQDSTMSSIVMIINSDSRECVVLPQKGYIFMLDLAPCHNSKRTRTFLEYNGIPALK